MISMFVNCNSMSKKNVIDWCGWMKYNNYNIFDVFLENVGIKIIVLLFFIMWFCLDNVNVWIKMM